MAIQVFEKWKSRAHKASVVDPSINIIYGVKGTLDETEVDANILAAAPATWNGLQLQSWQAECLGPTDDGGLWEVTVLYDRTDPKGPGSVQMTFDTLGGKEKVTQSKQTIASYGMPLGSTYVPIGGLVDPNAPTTAPDMQGSINVTDTSIEGVDVTVPKMELTVICIASAALPPDGLPTDYFQTLEAAVGTTNNGDCYILYKNQVLYFREDELLYMGGNHGYRGNGEWELNCKFGVSRTVENITVGGGVDQAAQPPLVIPEKRGWHYLWVRYKEGSNGGRFTRTPLAVYIEKVYDQEEFQNLFQELGFFSSLPPVLPNAL